MATAFPQVMRSCRMRVCLDDDSYSAQLLCDRENALFLTEKMDRETKIVIDSLWQHQPEESDSLITTCETGTSESDLKTLLDGQSSVSRDAYIFIPQASSWSPLNISPEMFRMLLQKFEIFPAFAEIISSFGRKSSEIDEQSPRCFSKFCNLEVDPGRVTSCEIAYNLYHVEEHGRSGLKDPWSIRQTAVYHKWSSSQISSTWIFVQLGQRIRHLIDPSRKEEHTGGTDSSTTPPANSRLHPVALHHVIFKSCQRNWKEYIRYLTQCSSKLHEIACFSEVDHQSDHDYSLQFADCQGMELLLRKIRRAISILEAQLRSLEQMNLYCRKLQLLTIPELMIETRLGGFFQLEFEECQETIKSNIRDLKSLLLSTESTRSLLFEILDHRNDAAIHENGASLNSLTQKTSFQSEVMLSMGEVTRYDSRTVRIISFIAMIYLPISLVSTFFSSTIMQLASADATNPQGELQREIGVFVGVTVVLTGLTVAGAFYWQRRGELLRLSKRQIAV